MEEAKGLQSGITFVSQLVTQYGKNGLSPLYYLVDSDRIGLNQTWQKWEVFWNTGQFCNAQNCLKWSKFRLTRPALCFTSTEWQEERSRIAQRESQLTIKQLCGEGTVSMSEQRSVESAANSLHAASRSLCSGVTTWPWAAPTRSVTAALWPLKQCHLKVFLYCSPVRRGPSSCQGLSNLTGF